MGIKSPDGLRRKISLNLSSLKFNLYRIWWWIWTGDWVNGSEPYVSPSSPPSTWDQVYEYGPTIASWSPSVSEAYDTGVELYLDLSTGHVSHEDWLKLQEWNEDSPIRVRHHRYGLIMWIPDDREEFNDLPETIRQIAIYAKANGCWLINFDQDGQIINGLDCYAW